MDCLFCSAQLTKCEETFFYLKGEKDVHLTIKPEFEATVIGKATVNTVTENKKSIRVKCSSCNNNLGRVLPFGPGGTKFYAFALDKVKVNGRVMKKTQRWWNTYIEFPMIETRDSNNFFNILKNNISIEEKEKKQEPLGRIVFPSLLNLSEFEWVSVSLSRQPRRYQIEAFIEVLQRNLIVVIKTGAGKTLIASMFLGRMCALNPHRMGLFIVDRIPLVFQQGDAIHSDTNLRVARICGENKTTYKVKQLNEGAYDVLVVTAGAFHEMLQKKQVDVDLFCAVVFDECHHVSGGHRYVDCLKAFTLKPLLYQPRILGLSASIFSAESLIQAENRLVKYMAYFPHAKIYHPSLPKSDLTIQKKTIKLTYIQHELIEEIVHEVNRILLWVCRAARISISELELRTDLLNAYRVKGEVRALLGEYSSIPNFDDQIKNCQILIECTEICETLGVPFALKLLKDNNILTDVVRKHKDVSSLSNRLQALKEMLSKSQCDSKVLVFVSTRNVARELFNCLEAEFPSFNMGKVFGHGGHDGMIWEGEQEHVLQEFSSGKCNLIICTSVLEEGLDVSACDLVICFSGVRNLIQFIQARGRARKENSRFIFFQTAEEEQRSKDIEAKEEMLSSVLKLKQQEYCYFSDLSKDIIKKIDQELTADNSSCKPDLPLPLIDASERSKEFTFNVYADIVDGIDINKMKTKLLHILEEHDDFRINRLEIVTVDTQTVLLSSKHVAIFLVGAVCRSMITKTAYMSFCRSFDFQIELEDFKSHVWTRQNVIAFQKLESVTEVSCMEYGTGFLRNKISAVISKRFEKQAVIKFTPKKHFEIITYSVSGPFPFMVSVSIMIPLASLGEFALMKTNLGTCILAIPLKYPPRMYYECPRTYKWVRFLGIEEMQYFANMPVLFLTFDIENMDQIKQIVFSKSLFPVDTFDVNMKFSDLSIVEVDESNVNSKVRKLLYTIKCLEDSRRLCSPDNFVSSVIKLIMETNTEIIELVLEKLFDVAMRSHYFLDVCVTFNRIYQEFSSFPANIRKVLHLQIPENHFLVKRVVVTPSRVVHLPAIPVASNRLLRKMREKEFLSYDIIILSFKDEDMTKLLESPLFERVRTTIANGILINGVEYRFLCSSGSQLRAHKGYFVSAASHEEVVRIRLAIIPDPSGFKSAAQYLSRLGQYGTADKFVTRMSKGSISWIEDDRAMNGDLTTDGAGKINLSFAATIAGQLGIDSVPSAFQVRYSGVKGILVCCPDNDPDFHGRNVCFRQSMQKFDNDDEDLTIVSVSKISELTLNREVITLLSAVNCDWFLNNTLMNYQEKALASCADIFMDGAAAREALKAYLPKSYIDKLKSHYVDVVEEKYWFKVLQGIYRLKVILLKTKTNIPIEKGCILVGVPDPVGILRDDEVFVQLKRDGKEEVLNDAALVYRNPCLHPGDHRRVQCVYRQELQHLFNVIVMPVKNCTYSLASACSGGDLDGDKFGIIWDSNFVPGEEHIFPPCDYASLAEAPMSSPTIPNYSDEVDDRSFANFYVNFLKNDCLGRVAHKHLALCDILSDGARDPLAIEMAKSQSTAVDYPKTGILPTVPKEALKTVDREGFPDFMEKPREDTYPSKKILGKLYRRCVSICYNFEFLSNQDRNIMNTNLIVEGNEEFLDEAAKAYRSYAYNMEKLMVRFNLKVEADLILGFATFGWGLQFQTDIGKTSDAIAACYDMMVQKYRELFLNDVLDNETQMKKASAWYRVVNDPSIKVKNVHTLDKKFFSFPWVVYDVLCSILLVHQRQQPSRVRYSIGNSALELFKKNSTILSKNIADKMKAMKDVENSIDRLTKEHFDLKNGFLVNLYGSTSIYVCEPESDVDISVYPKSKVQFSSIIPDPQNFMNIPEIDKEKHFLRLVVSPAVDTISSSKKELLDRKHPIVYCISGDSENPISCDISMSEVGIRKTLYIQSLYKGDPCYLPLFWVLVRWARVSGLVKSVDESSSVMDTADFYALIIHLLDCPPLEKCEVEPPSRKANIKYLYRCLDTVRFQQVHNLGRLIFSFFQKASTLSGNLNIEWPAPRIPPVQLDESAINRVADLAGSSFHFLVATRDATNLHSYCISNLNETKQFQKVLPLSISYAIGKAHAYHAARLSCITGAVVTIELPDGKENLVLKGEGTNAAIDNLRSEIQLLLTTNKALVLGRLPNQTSRYFMEGSSIIIVKGNTSIKSQCIFSPSFGPFELIHHDKAREILLLKHNTTDKLWEEKEFERFLTHVTKQMEMVPKSNAELKKTLEITARFGCFYVVDGASHLPVSQSSISIQELQYSMEKGRRSRKAWKRGDYCKRSPPQEEKSPEYRFKKVPLRPAGGSRFTEEVQRTFKKQKRGNKRGMATAFTPGFLKLNSRDDSPRDQLMKIYHQVFTTCGFKHGQTHSRQQFTYKVTCNPSTSFEVQLTLDEDMSVIKLDERPLNWVHGTVVSGVNQQFTNDLMRTCDIRLTIGTTDPVRKDSPLYKDVLPELNGRTVLPIGIKDGKPVIPAVLAKKSKQLVNTVRHIQTKQIYTNGSVDASIVYGECYYGKNLVLTRPFCELSLYFNSGKLAECINEYLDEELLRELVDEYFKCSLLFQETLEKTLDQFGAWWRKGGELKWK